MKNLVLKVLSELVAESKTPKKKIDFMQCIKAAEEILANLKKIKADDPANKAFQWMLSKLNYKNPLQLYSKLEKTIDGKDEVSLPNFLMYSWKMDGGNVKTATGKSREEWLKMIEVSED